MIEREYRRLTRSRTRGGSLAVIATRCSLWLGRDHLLSIGTTGYVEEYRRFYFKDIQALTFCRTRRATIWTWVLSIPAVLLTALSLSFFTEPGGTSVDMGILWGTFAAVLTMALAVNLALGPACIASVQTAVQTYQLPSLSRVRKTRRVFQQLRILIEQAQSSSPVTAATPDSVAPGVVASQSLHPEQGTNG